MTKQLTPLEALEILKEANTIYCGCASNLFARYRFEIETIETALKDNHFYLYIIDKICKYLGIDVSSHRDLVETENEILNTLVENEKKFKALEIIKELLNLKVVEILPNDSDTRLFVSCGNFKASILIPPAYIDLLKEVLK